MALPLYAGAPMTLATKIFNTTRTLCFRLLVGGVLLQPVGATGSTAKPGVIGMRWGSSKASPVPVLTADLTRIPSWMVRGLAVDLFVGYDEEYIKVFTGHLQTRSPNSPGRTSQIACTGQLHRLFRSIEINDRDVTGLTVAQAIQQILDYVGIADSKLNVPAFTLGTKANAILERASSADMVQRLLDIDGLTIYETGAGTAIVRKVDSFPAPSPFVTYTTDNTPTARIIAGSEEEDPSYIRTRLVFTGATVVEGTAPDQTSRTITATAVSVNNLLAQPPLLSGSHIDAEGSNPLVDTDAKATEVAARLLTELARVPHRFTLEVPGNPLLELGQTVQLNFPEMNIANRLYVLEGVDHEISASRGYVSRLALHGGDELGGTIGIAPVADFTVSLVRQVISDRVYVVATFNGNLSHDLDGTIASYAWSDDETTTPEIATITTAVATVRIDPATITGTWNVTLTVTDNDGLTGAITKSIDVAGTNTLVTIPSLFAALDTNASASQNGGENWNDRVLTGIISVGTRVQDGVQYGIALFGASDGKIYRTLDYLITAPTQVATLGVAVIDVRYDWRNLDAAWALTADGKVYISTNGGASFVLYKDIRSWSGLGSTLVLGCLRLPAAGGIWVYGGYDDGVGGQPFVAYQATIPYGDWKRVTLGGELDADCPSSNGMKIQAAVDKEDGGGLVILLTGAGFVTKGLYWTPNVLSPSSWKRATGLDAGLFNGRILAPAELPGTFFAAFDNRDIWKSTNGIAWTKQANILPTGVTANDAHWLYAPSQGLISPGVYIIAAENAAKTLGLYLTADEFQTVQALRPATGFDAWPTNARGLKIAAGPTLGRTSGVAFTASLDATVKTVLYRKNEAVWHQTQIATALSACDITKIRCLTSSVWVVLGFTSATAYTTSKAIKTTNGGTSFSAISSPGTNEMWQDIQRAADGRFWGVTINSATPNAAKIWYSDNSGSTWTQAYSATVTGRRLCHIACHPTNGQRIAAYGTTGGSGLDVTIVFTNDRGASWVANVATNITASDQGHEEDIAMLPTSATPRIIVCGVKQVTTDRRVLIVTDNFGTSWSWITITTPTTDHYLGPVFGMSGGKLFVMRSTTTVSTIYMSANGGNTWVAIATVPRRSAGDEHKGGLAYDERQDLLLTSVAAGYAFNEKLIEQFAPAGPDGAWNDMSDRAVPVGAYTSYSVNAYAQQIAVIP